MSPEVGTVVVNTGDDETFYGLHVSPDVDTVIYHLSGLGDDLRGWGIQDDSFNALEMLSRLGLETWFKIGDRDLAVHVYRTMRLLQGASLTLVTTEIAERLGVGWRVYPMSDDRVRTVVETELGEMLFQTYFVKHQHSLRISRVKFAGSDKARPTTQVLEALEQARYIIVCPSNPVVSIGPILSLPGVRDLLVKTEATVLAVSPIVGGRALKGPAADMMRDLGVDVSPVGVAEFYRDFLDILVIDVLDKSFADDVKALGIKPIITDTVMKTLEDKVRLAKICLEAVGWPR